MVINQEMVTVKQNIGEVEVEVMIQRANSRQDNARERTEVKSC